MVFEIGSFQVNMSFLLLSISVMKLRLKAIIKAVLYSRSYSNYITVIHGKTQKVDTKASLLLKVLSDE